MPYWLATGEPHDLPDAARLRATAELARAAGAVELVGGQVDDLAFPGNAADAGVVESIHARKTAALIRAAIVGGASLAGAAPGVLERLGRFGTAVGISFQIADDLLDAKNGESCSLLRVMDVDSARSRAEFLFETALAEVEGLGEPAEPLRSLARFAFRRSE